VGDHVFLKEKEKRRSLKFGSCKNLEIRYCRPFEFIERIGPATHMIYFPVFMRVHSVFHVSLLKKYVLDCTMI